MKNSLRSMRIAAVLVALVLIAAACSDGSSARESTPLAPDTAEPSSQPLTDSPGDTPAVAAVCAPDVPDCTDTLVGGGAPEPLPADEPLPPARDGEPGTGTDPDRDQKGIEAFQIDGVWVFQHQPEVAMDALHSGAPEIVNGCLVVDNTIVVWHIDGIEVAADTIAAVRAGESPQLLIGGGGISLDEGARPDQIPTIIIDLCPTSAVWFGAP